MTATTGELNSRLEALEQLVRQLQADVEALRKAPLVADDDASSRLGLAQGERRTVTVLFADVSGFTTLAEKLDPEDCNSIMRETLGAVAQAVTDEGGHVEKFIGDAVCALFGAPTAYEDEPQRAARAALRMHAVLRELADRRPGLPPLTVHIGINTGPVIAGGVGDGSQYGVMGDTINTAARLMDAAESRQTFVSAATARRLRRGFELRDAGTLSLKGKSDQIVTFELVAQREKETPAPTLVAPFLGRERELAVMTDEERGVTVVCADAGMGKSRLFDEAERALRDEATVLRATAAAYGATPLQLAAEALAPLIDTLPPGPEREICATLIDANPEHVHGDLQGELVRLLESASAQRRVAVLLDGIDTADPSSLALLRFLIPATAGIRVHWILGTRPGSPVATTLASSAPEHRTLTLDRLSVDASVRILMALLPGALDEATALALAPRVAGNPEFCAEIAMAFIDEGLVVEEEGGSWRAVGDLSRLTVPGTLREMIEARLEGLDSGARQAIQAAAVIGPRFDAQLVRSVVSLSEPVDAALAELAEADLVRPPGPGASTWSFRAPIAQEVVYDSILKRRRPELHMRVAEAMLTMSDRDPSEVAEALAHHFSAAGDTARAAEHLAVAARRAFLSRGFAAADDLATRAVALGNSKPPLLLGLRAKARFLSGDIGGALRDVDDLLSQADADPKAVHHATWVLVAAENSAVVNAAATRLRAHAPYATAASAAAAVADAAASGEVRPFSDAGTEETASHVLLARGLLTLWGSDAAKAVDLLSEAHDLAARSDHVLIALMADEARAEAMAVAGDAAGAAALADSLAALATERQDAAGLARARLLQAEAALTRGDVPEAHATAEAVLRDPAATPTARARALSLIARAARATGGDPDGRSEAAARSAAEGVWLGWWIQHRLSAA